METLFLIFGSIFLLTTILLTIVIIKITNNHYIEIEEEQFKQNDLKTNYLDGLIFTLDTIKKSSILYEDELIQKLHKGCLSTQKFLEDNYYIKEEEQNNEQ